MSFMNMFYCNVVPKHDINRVIYYQKEKGVEQKLEIQLRKKEEQTDNILAHDVFVI